MKKEFSVISILWYAIAMFLPIIYFTALTDNTNETKPWLVFIVCPVLYGVAGWLAVPGDRKDTEKMKWVIWSVIVGIVEAAALVFMV